jgi:hypothetical protein
MSNKIIYLIVAFLLISTSFAIEQNNSEFIDNWDFSVGVMYVNNSNLSDQSSIGQFIIGNDTNTLVQEQKGLFYILSSIDENYTISNITIIIPPGNILGGGQADSNWDRKGNVCDLNVKPKFLYLKENDIYYIDIYNNSIDNRELSVLTPFNEKEVIVYDKMVYLNNSDKYQIPIRTYFFDGINKSKIYSIKLLYQTDCVNSVDIVFSNVSFFALMIRYLIAMIKGFYTFMMNPFNLLFLAIVFVIIYIYNNEVKKKKEKEDEK